MTSKRADLVDSTAALVASAQKGELHDPPADLPKLLKRERARWDELVQCRINWSSADLRVLYQAIKTESDYIKVQSAAKKAPLYFETQQGSVQEHPVHKTARATFKQWQDALRFLGLNTRPMTPSAQSTRRTATAGADRGKQKSSLLKSV